MAKLHKPYKFAMALLHRIMGPKLKRKYNFTFDNEEIKGLKPPYIVVYNHIGERDHYLMEEVLYPLSANNMSSRWVAYDKKKSWITAFGGCYYKTRFSADVESILNTKTVLRKFKNVAALAPAGVYCFDGTPHTLEYSTCRLFKMFNVPVVAVKFQGLYMHKNTFHPRTMTGKLHAKAVVLFTPQQLKEASEQEIYQKMYQALDFNDFIYQEQEGFKVIGENRTEGMEKVIYHCLRCGEEFCYKSDGEELYCEKCGNRIKLNEYYHFEPSSTECKYVPALDIWNKIQQDLIDKECERDDYCITDTCEVWHNDKTKKLGYVKYGDGKIELNRKGMFFTGIDNGQTVTYEYPIEKTTTMGYDLASNHISVEREKEVTFYRLSEPRKILKIVQSITIMRNKYYPNFEGERQWLLNLPSNQRDKTILSGDK